MSTVELNTGPCEPWTDGASVAACCSADIGSDDPDAVFADSILAASELLYELSGHQFSGLCTQRVRPCSDSCGCWDYIFSPAQVPAVPWGWGDWGWGLGWGYEGCSNSDSCSCGTVSRVLLQGYPVRSITEVVIVDEVLDAAGYRLDQNRWLTRLADANGTPQLWPGCQNLALDVGEPGTWYVDYTTGQEPPVIGQGAAAQLACQLYLACSGQGEAGACLLPQGVTKIVRQQVTIERAPFLSWGMQSGQWATGIPLVDAFLSAFNPAGFNARPTVWSPDAPSYGLLVDS